MSDFLPFQKFIPKALAKYKMTRSARAALVCERFRGLATDVLGEKCAGLVKPKFFKNNILYISVPSSTLAQSVYVHRHDLIAGLNADLDKDPVHDIRTLVE